MRSCSKARSSARSTPADSPGWGRGPSCRRPARVDYASTKAHHRESSRKADLYLGAMAAPAERTPTMRGRARPGDRDAALARGGRFSSPTAHVLRVLTARGFARARVGRALTSPRGRCHARYEREAVITRWNSPVSYARAPARSGRTAANNRRAASCAALEADESPRPPPPRMG